MSQMIRVQRAYEQIATIMQQQDDLRTGAIEWFGSIDAQLRALLNVHVAALYASPY